MSRNYYEKGSWNIIDDVSGQKIKASKVRLRWDGLYTTKENWEPRHPQEFLRARSDDTSVPYSRPLSADSFVVVNRAVGISVINQAVLNGSIINGRGTPLITHQTAYQYIMSPTTTVNGVEINKEVINGPSSIL